MKSGDMRKSETTHIKSINCVWQSIDSHSLNKWICAGDRIPKVEGFTSAIRGIMAAAGVYSKLMKQQVENDQYRIYGLT